MRSTSPQLLTRREFNMLFAGLTMLSEYMVSDREDDQINAILNDGMDTQTSPLSAHKLLDRINDRTVALSLVPVPDNNK